MTRLALRIAPLALIPLAASASPTTAAAAPRQPNIIVIVADDLGYGDLSCYGATKLKTPNIDALAAAGMRFTDGYAPSPTCTPTRYSLLTGEYPWRKKGTGILPGDAALIIEPGRATPASVLKERGYATAAVGKWHLGFGTGKVDFNANIAPGPRELGFDYTFNMAATGDRVPCVYIENGRVVGLDPKDPIAVSYSRKVGDWPTLREVRGQPLPGAENGVKVGGRNTVKTNSELIRMDSSVGHDGTIVNGIGRIGFMTGGKAALWDDRTLGDTFAGKALEFIERSKDRPFFLYYAAHEPHVPRDPHPRFVGKSGLGARGDAILQLDESVGRIRETLTRLGIADDTLILLTSDNGPAPEDGYADGSEALEEAAGHSASGPLRGQKCSVHEGGVRVPFLAAWPARIKPGATSSAVVCSIDLLATVADIAGRPLAPKDGPDSFSFLPALLGSTAYARPPLLLEAYGSALGPSGIRSGNDKLIVKPVVPKHGGPVSCEVTALHDLTKDIHEDHNIAAAHPETVEALKRTLLRDWTQGYTRPGAEKLR